MRGLKKLLGCIHSSTAASRELDPLLVTTRLMTNNCKWAQHMHNCLGKNYTTPKQAILEPSNGVGCAMWLQGYI
jgi:hypothetical protein